MSGHLFIVRGDLLKLACDHVLIPSGRGPAGLGYISRKTWRNALAAEVDQRGMVARAPSESARVVVATSGTAIDAPTLWVGHTGEANQTPQWYADAVECFIREAVRRGAVDGPRPLDDKRPLLGMPLVGTGDGGARARRGEVLEAIMSTIKTTLDDVDADVVLVLSHDEGFSAAQQARRNVFGHQAWTDIKKHTRQAIALAERARQGDLVLFVGAGASIGAGLPSWSALLDKLADKCADPPDRKRLAALDARDAGAVLERRIGGRSVLGSAIAELATSEYVSLVHQLLASLPVDEIVTTNYDTCLERAFDDAGRELRVLPRQRGGGAPRWLLKLHGSIDDKKRIVLSRGDYLRFEGEGAALAGVVQALLLTRHMLFVGYSLQDDNFHRLFHEVRGAVGAPDQRPDDGPFATVLSPAPSGLMEEIWEGDLEHVSTAKGRAHDPRRVAILLDFVAADAAPAAAHLLDNSYLAMFNRDEQRLRKELLEVWDIVHDESLEIPKAGATR